MDDYGCAFCDWRLPVVVYTLRLSKRLTLRWSLVNESHAAAELQRHAGKHIEEMRWATRYL